jgi:hypothetical protein
MVVQEAKLVENKKSVGRDNVLEKRRQMCHISDFTCTVGWMLDVVVCHC